MGETTMPFGSELDLMHEVVVAGRSVGADAIFWRKLRDDPAQFEQIVHGVFKNAFANRCSLAMTASIMGKWFFGPTAARQYFGVGVKGEMFNTVPLGYEALLSLKDDYILAAVPSISIRDIMTKYPQHIDLPVGWKNEPFLDVRTEPGWYLVRWVRGQGHSLTWEQQQEMVQPPAFIPDAGLMVAVFTMRALQGQENVIGGSHWTWFRTATTIDDVLGSRVVVDIDTPRPRQSIVRIAHDAAHGEASPYYNVAEARLLS